MEHIFIIATLTAANFLYEMIGGRCNWNGAPDFYLEAFRDYKRPKIHRVNLKYLDLDGFDCYVGIPFGGCMVRTTRSAAVGCAA